MLKKNANIIFIILLFSSCNNLQRADFSSNETKYPNNAGLSFTALSRTVSILFFWMGWSERVNICRYSINIDSTISLWWVKSIFLKSDWAQKRNASVSGDKGDSETTDVFFWCVQEKQNKDTNSMNNNRFSTDFYSPSSLHIFFWISVFS